MFKMLVYALKPQISCKITQNKIVFTDQVDNFRPTNKNMRVQIYIYALEITTVQFELFD